MNVAEILANTLSADSQIRQDATSKLENAAAENFSGYTVALVQELVNEQNPSHVRTAAGLALKNTMTAKDSARQEELAQKWMSIDVNTKLQVKQATLQTLGSADHRAGTAAAQVTTAIAAIELPQNEWTDLVKVLLSFMETDNTNLKQSSLQTIGFICESIAPEILATQANEILTAVVQGARKEEPSQEVRLAAISALLNSLEFVRDNFEHEGERNYIMQVVCEATQSPDVQVQVAAFECLVRIMQLYYDKMPLYMEKALFGLTVFGMKHEEEKVALQAVEFWSTVCDEEIELALDAAEAAENNEQPDRISHQFANLALPQILPVLLFLLTKQDEDADEDEWNVSMAAATCLSLLAQCVEDAIVAPVIPFIEGNIRHNDWHQREAAVMAFGSIMEGPSDPVLSPLIQQALPVLIEMVKDPVVHVQDTTAWTLGRILDCHITAIQFDVHLQPLIAALLGGLSDNPRIVSNCCWSIMTLAEQLGGQHPDSDDSGHAETDRLSPYFQDMVTALVKFTEMNVNQSNSRSSAYEAMSTLSLHCSNDCMAVVSELAVAMLGRLEYTVKHQDQLVNQDDRLQHTELQSNLCGLLTNIVRRAGKEFAPLADRLMTVLLQLISSAGKRSTIVEDAFICVGALITALESDFNRYLESFNPMLEAALQNHQEYQLCSIAIGLIGDICRSMTEQAVPYCDGYMTLLINNLQSPVLHRDVKPTILSCFGDIAIAIGPKFETYREPVMTLLQQACTVATGPTANSYDLIDYNASLQHGILEAFIGMVQGFKDTPQVASLGPSVHVMVTFVNVLYSSEERSDALTRAMIGLLGDIAGAFPPGQLRELLAADWVSALIKEGRRSRTDSNLRSVSKWANQMVKQAIN
ncbi:karyopherin Kap95 [Dimargaris cristalligena]|nr:karyopherin Kap95 [Dimargaris cristalligena]